MAESLFISEGHVVDASGTRIATLTELAESERITALENRIAALENAQRPPTPSPPMPGTVVGGGAGHGAGPHGLYRSPRVQSDDSFPAARGTGRSAR